MAITYKIYRNSNPEGLGELVHEGDSLNVALADQPHGRHYYKFTATNEYGTSRPSIAYEGVSVAPGQAISFANGIGKVTLNLEALTGADTLHLEGRNSDSEAWTEAYAGTNLSHEFISAESMFTQWRYYGRYGADFKGDASPAAIYTAPTIGAATLSFTMAGGMVTFTYTGGEGAMIAELMVASTVIGTFTNKSITIPMPAANTTYHVRLRAGFVTVNSNMMTVVIALNPITIDFNEYDTEYIVPAGYNKCMYSIRGGMDHMAGEERATYIYRNNTLMDSVQGEYSYQSGNFSVTGGDKIRVELATWGGGTVEGAASMTLTAEFPPINVDISNASYTVPAGYTKCEYWLAAMDESSAGANAWIYKNNTTIDSVYAYFGEQNISGQFEIKVGDILRGEGDGTRYTVAITLTKG